MKIFSNSVKDGYLHENFGGNTREKNTKNKSMVNKSFHIAWEDLPEGTKSLAIIFDDHDAIPVCGFTWIHWIACNINPEWNELKEDASMEMKGKFTQGLNSWYSGLLGDNKIVDCDSYGGCAPPDKDHIYTLTIYALDKMLSLKEGFFKNQLLFEMNGHILEKKIINIKYKKINS